MGSSTVQNQGVDDTHINNVVNNFKNTQSSDITHTTNSDKKHIVEGNKVGGTATVIHNGANYGTQIFQLQNLYAGAHHLTPEQEAAMHNGSGHGDEDHMHGADEYLQNLYAGAHHLTPEQEAAMHNGSGHGDEDHMHGADEYLQNLYAGAHHLTPEQEAAMHNGSGHGDEDHMHGADEYLEELGLFRKIKHGVSKATHTVKKVATSSTTKKILSTTGKVVVAAAKNPIVQKVAVDAAIAAVAQQELEELGLFHKIKHGVTHATHAVKDVATSSTTKKILSTTGKVAVSVAKNPIVQQVAIDAAIDAAAAQQQLVVMLI